MVHVPSVARAACVSVSDGKEAPEVRLAGVGFVAAALAADDDALRVLASSGCLEKIRSALRMAAGALDVPPLAQNARGLLRAMGEETEVSTERPRSAKRK